MAPQQIAERRGIIKGEKSSPSHSGSLPQQTPMASVTPCPLSIPE